MTTFDDFLRKQLECPDIKTEYDKLEREFASIQARIDADENTSF